MKRAVLILFVLAGCGGTRFEALTAPPPGKEASLNDKKRTIHLSQGVALAFECFDVQSSGPCGAGEIASDAPEVAAVFPAYLDDLTPHYRQGPQPRTAFVVVGKAAGKTEIHLETNSGGAHFQVEVLE